MAEEITNDKIMKQGHSCMSAHRRTIVLLLVILAGCAFLGYVSIIYMFDNIKVKTLNNLPGHMLWAHRGYAHGLPENSLESFDAARKMGCYGIELDIHFIEGRGFIVAHDLPAKESGKGDHLFLNKVLDRYRDRFYYWLDFKNLDRKNAEKSGELLSAYIAAYGLEGHVFVESTRPWALRALKSVAPRVNTIYWLRGHFERRFAALKAKYNTVISGADTVSLPVKYAGDIFFDNFSHLNIAVFTVNDAGKTGELFAKGARIILTDTDMRSGYPDAYRMSLNE
jgi:glycerophosphoryl diester phosphodiesterase